jgi:sensor domain CHASE-containing protein
MLPENDKNERGFDEMLKKNLKQHREPIRTDFAQELLAKIQKVEQQKVLAKVVRQERLAFAAFILLPIAAITVIFAFPNLAIAPTRFLEELYPLVNQAFEHFIKEWRLWVYYIFVAAACLYAFYESLLREN